MTPTEHLGQHCTFNITLQFPLTTGKGTVIAHSTKLFDEDNLQYLVASNDLEEYCSDILTSKSLKDWNEDPLTCSYINQIKNIEEFIGYRHRWFLACDIDFSSYSLEEIINNLNKEVQ